MERKTWRTVDVSTLVGVIEVPGTKAWQPTSISEELRETDSATYWSSKANWEYTVKVTGLQLRKDGSVGQMRAEAVFSAPELTWSAVGGIDQIPADIAALLVGADGLRDWKRAL